MELLASDGNMRALALLIGVYHWLIQVIMGDHQRNSAEHQLIFLIRTYVPTVHTHLQNKVLYLTHHSLDLILPAVCAIAAANCFYSPAAATALNPSEATAALTADSPDFISPYPYDIQDIFQQLACCQK